MFRRVALGLCFLIGAGFLVLAIMPFERQLDDAPLRCGPPAYELLVPPDEAWPVREDEGCPSAARQRVVIAGVGIVVTLVAAAVLLRGARDDTAESQTRWLQGDRRGIRGRRRRQPDERTPQPLPD